MVAMRFGHVVCCLKRSQVGVYGIENFFCTWHPWPSDVHGGHRCRSCLGHADIVDARLTPGLAHCLQVLVLAAPGQRIVVRKKSTYGDQEGWVHSSCGLRLLTP